MTHVHEDSENDENLESQPQSRVARTGSVLLELLKIAILAVIAIGLVRYFLFKPFYVKGQSMEPTFEERDYLIIDELSYRFREPKRGDVIVFEYHPSNDNYLKRVIGLPGERVKVEANKVIIYNEENPKGMVLSEDYLIEETAGSVNVTLGTNQYFVMGDNRGASFDSRRFGAIDGDDIVGRVWIRGWPFSRVSAFGAPIY